MVTRLLGCSDKQSETRSHSEAASFGKMIPIDTASNADMNGHIQPMHSRLPIPR